MRLWLQEIRGARTQSDIALKLGIAQGYYSDIENGNKDPRPKLAKKIAAALGFDWTLFFEDDVKQQTPGGQAGQKGESQ